MDLLEAVIGLGPESLLRHRPRRLHPGLPPAQAEGRGRRRCSSSTPRASSRRAAPRTNCCPSTSSASTAGIATSQTSKASPASSRSTRSPPTTTTSTSRATSSRRSSETVLTVAEAMQRLQGQRSTRPSRPRSKLVAAAQARGAARSERRRITQQQLESYLWGAAMLLRGTIDAGDYKQFIFPLLFFKRLCDVFDEETQTALAESGGDADFAALPGEPPLPDPARARTGATFGRPPRTSARRSRRRCAPSRPPTRTSSTASSATRSGPTRTACPTRRCAT